MNHLMSYVFVRLKTDEFTVFSRKKLQDEYPEITAQRCIVVNHYHTYLSMVKHNAAFMIGNKWQISELEKWEFKVQHFLLSNIDIVNIS